MSKAAPNPKSKRPSDLELEAIQVIWHRFENDERDMLAGGVPPAAIARATTSSTGTITDLCLRLEAEGTLVALDGADPETCRARRSFAPAALFEGGEALAE